MTDAVADQQFDFAVTVAQVFSGVTFALVAIWMTFSNGASLAYIQRASLEKRLTTCCFINTYIGMFSAFFNFFQLTEVDDLILPDKNNYTIDIARPIMWMMTCPLMQLCLVILGGSKIPEWRRTAMPALSVFVLLCGLASTYFTNAWRFLFYFIGLGSALGMFALNAKQIQEHSDGQEGFFSGDSEYRKATLLVILLWFPFPVWYIFSPEGLGIITNDLLIQMGWSFLSLTAKFSFIFYVQKMKDSYCTKLKAKREMYKPSGGIGKELDGDLISIIMETLTFLGMAQHSDRIMNLFASAGVMASNDVWELTYDQCRQKFLPWDVVKAIQQRQRVWRLETQDNAEVTLKEGEHHYMQKKLSLEEESTTSSVHGGDELNPHDLALAIIPGSRPYSAKSNGSTNTKAKKIAHEQLTYLNDKIGDVGMKLEFLTERLESVQHSSVRSAVEEETNLLSKMESMIDSATARTEKSLMNVGNTLREDLRYVAQNTAAISEEVASGNRSQEETLADMRRQHMMLMELVSTDRDNINSKIEGLNSSLNGRIMNSQSMFD